MFDGAPCRNPQRKRHGQRATLPATAFRVVMEHQLSIMRVKISRKDEFIDGHLDIERLSRANIEPCSRRVRTSKC